MNEQWERQKRELDSYNTFYSSIKGEVTGEGLRDHGFGVVGRFVSIPHRASPTAAEPDFILFDGSTLLLVEIKSGTNIDDRTIDQMERCDDLSIEAAEDYLKEVDLSDPDLDPNDLRTIQPCVVFYSETIQECKEYPACVDALDELRNHTAVLTQEKGGTLEIDSGKVTDDAFETALSDGIRLPEAPAKNVYLTEGIELESIAFSICHDCVVNNIGRGRLTLSSAGVRDRYRNRELPLDDVNTALEFLEEVDACRENDDGEYEFRQAHLPAIVSVQEKLAEKSVEDWLDDDSEGQSGLDEFF